MLTALFVSIFLFFLSVALIYSNRQDIALSLSMEHKLKAQSAARSGAFEALARLRQFGDLQGYQSKTFPNGTVVDVELIELPSTSSRGEKTLLKCRGTSGPLSSYLTLHLRDVRIAGEVNEKDRRVLFFPSADPDTPSSKALFGDFILTEGGAGVTSDMVAQGGPIFVATDLSIEPGADPQTGYPPPYFEDFVPVFSPDGMQLSAWGVTYIVAPPFQSIAKSVTGLRYLTYENEEFKWKDVDPPKDIGSDDPEPQNGEIPSVFLMQAPPNDNWNTSSVRGIEDAAKNVAWKADKPPTQHSSDIVGGAFYSDSFQISGTKDWSLARGISTQEKFTTRGAIAAQGDRVVSHGWHYVFQHYRGTSGPGRPIEPTDGSRLTRWPCLLSYQVGGKWEKIWAPLTEQGSVNSSLIPDPNVLLITEGGQIFSSTIGSSANSRRLLTLNGDRFQPGNEIPNGYLFTYQEQPYVVTAEKFLNVADPKRSIEFDGLAQSLPEIRGEVVDVSGTEMVIIGLEGGYQGQPIDSTKRQVLVGQPRYDFTYAPTPTGPVAVDGKDLWAIITIDVKALQPEAKFRGYEELPYPETENPISVLARYDGERWHILPNGLRAAIKQSTLSAPGIGVIAAIFPSLPQQINRYSVIAIDTQPFKMSR